MTECKKYLEGKAFHDINIDGKKLTLCDIEEGTCPYKNDGKRFHHLDDNKWYSICKTNGLIRVVEIPTVFTS